MARDDDGEGISAQSLPNRSRPARNAEYGGNLAVGERLRRRDRTRRIVNTSMERRDAFHVQHDSGEVAALTAQVGGNRTDRVPNGGWRRQLASLRDPLDQPRSGMGHVTLRELDGHDAPVAPGNPAMPERRVEQVKTAHYSDIKTVLSNQ